MHIDQWLQQCHDEKTKEAAPDLEEVFSWMEPEDLIKVANGEATVDEVLEKLATKKTLGENIQAAVEASPITIAKRKLGLLPPKKGKTKTSEAKLAFMDKVARQIAREHYVVVKEAEKKKEKKPWYKKNPPLPLMLAGAGYGGQRLTQLVGEDLLKKKVSPAVRVAGAAGGVAVHEGLRYLRKKIDAKKGGMDKVARQIARTHYEVEKLAKEKKHQKSSIRRLHENDKAQSMIGRALGGAVGGAGGFAGGSAAGGRVAQLLKRGRRKGKMLGSIVGTGLGAAGGFAGGTALGALNARFNKKFYGKVDKLRGSEGMEKKDAFTSPEAQAKAKTMSTAMSASKGAPAKVRKAAVKHVGQKIASLQKESGSSSLSKLRRALGNRSRKLMPREDVLSGKFSTLLGKKPDPTLTDSKIKELKKRISHKVKSQISRGGGGFD